jgi:hypothetical protein
MLKRILESIVPIENPILSSMDEGSIRYGSCHDERLHKRKKDVTYKNAVRDGLVIEVRFEPSVFSRRTAKQPVVPPMSRLTIRRMLGIKSSFTIFSQPRF